MQRRASSYNSKQLGDRDRIMMAPEDCGRRAHAFFEHDDRDLFLRLRSES